MSWRDVIRSVAPVLGTALGGPMGGVAIKTLANKFLGGEDASISDLEKQLEGVFTAPSPETLVELKKLDKEFDVKMKALDVDVFKLETQDKQNARKENKTSAMPAMLSVGLTLAVVTILYLLFYVTVPTGSKEVLFMLLGVVIKEWGNAMQYWFGTTRSSSDKTAMMAKSLGK